MTLDDLNTMSVGAFVKLLEEIYEHSPWVAVKVAPQRPFHTLDDLAEAMRAAVDAEGAEAQLALIRAHPDLAGKAARAHTLTTHSTQEQAGAGLDQLSDEEYQKFHTLNEAYKATFDFPFILAVKGHTKDSILASFTARLPHDLETERQTAISEIHTIARYRLEALLS